MSLHAHADLYRSLGLNPLPSKDCGGRLHPPFRYGPARDKGLSEKSFNKIVRDKACDAIQLATGSAGGLLAIDLDGSMAVEVWRLWTLHRDDPPTWKVQHDPHGGMHVLYSLPAGTKAVPHKAWLWWVGDDPTKSKHNAIEALGDRNLIVAPPSVSLRTGRPYAFLPGCGPEDIERPAPAPGWLMSLIAKQAVTPVRLAARSCRALPPVRVCTSPAPRLHLSWDAVRNAIPDKLELLRSWGVRIVSDHPSPKGWYRARSVFREDRNPSAAVNDFGDYWEPDYDHSCLSIFQLAVALGLYRNFSEAVDGIGIQYGVRQSTWRPQQQTVG